MPDTSSGLPTPQSSPQDEKATRLGTLPQNRPPARYRHPWATPQGTYINCVEEGVEGLHKYEEGGYHPVHLDEFLDLSDRYRTLHKLGYGGYATVWLCRDTQQGRYVAVKVMVAGVEDVPELSLSRLDQTIPGAEFILSPLDHFTIHGPNGFHQCLVLPLLGPPVSPDLWIRMRHDPSVALQKMARQAAQGLSYLHRNQICHGGICTLLSLYFLRETNIVIDFRAANILVRLTNIDHLPEDELFSLIEEPEKIPVQYELGGDPPTSCPKYLVPKADMTGLTESAYLTDQITIVDFGESFRFSSPPARLGIPRHYLPPELLPSGGSPAAGPAADLWALACTLFEIRQQKPLFRGKPDELICQMVRALGKPPTEIWNKWEARKDFFDDEAKWVRDSSTFSLEQCLEERRSIYDPDPGMRGYMETPDAERKLMADLLYQLFQFDPAKRLKADHALEHEWLSVKG